MTRHTMFMKTVTSRTGFSKAHTPLTATQARRPWLQSKASREQWRLLFVHNNAFDDPQRNCEELSVTTTVRLILTRNY